MSYQSIIIKATGCTVAEASGLEDIMRHDIFHSTLDWQTKEQLQEAAREAVLIQKELDKLPTE